MLNKKYYFTNKFVENIINTRMVWCLLLLYEFLLICAITQKMYFVLKDQYKIIIWVASRYVILVYRIYLS